VYFLVLTDFLNVFDLVITFGVAFLTVIFAVVCASAYVIAAMYDPGALLIDIVA